MPLSRRSLLAGSVAAAAGLTLGGAAQGSARGAPHRRTPLKREDHRVVIVGSGFGGGVSALRLAQAGVPCVVLERGLRWPTGPDADAFPSATNPDKRILWHQSSPQLFGRPVAFEPYAGLIEAAVGENMTALCPSGVGGGSLIYQGMSLKPSEEVFTTWFPSEINWPDMDRVYYPRVAQMLKLATAPDELIASPNYQASRVFADRARAAGLPLEKIPMPIDWEYALAELRGEMRPSYTNGDGGLGVNNGGKHSVDVTYLAAAEATGMAQIRPLHDVTSIERAADGTWIVHVNRTDSSGNTVEHLILTTKALILAAGSVNSTRLLVRARAHGSIPDLPDSVGDGWGTNADRIYTWTSPTGEFGTPQGGPVVYGSLNWADPMLAHTVIQASIPALPMDIRSTVLVGYGVSKTRGRFQYDARTDQANLVWPRDGDADILNKAIHPTVHKIVSEPEVLLDTNLMVPSTWHPLGGANMAATCDVDGRVHGQRGLYVLDGALMPGNTAACNPSMTIAAVAERALDNLVRTDVGPVI